MMGPLRHRPSDPAHADQAERLARDVRAEHVGGPPAGPVAAPEMALALAGAAGRHEQERHREIGRRVGEHVRRVRDGDPAGLGGLDVDVVEADAEIGHQLRPAGLGGEHLVGDLVGDGGEEGIRASEGFPQAVHRQRSVLRIEARVELAGERLMHRLGEAAGHHHDRTRAHVPTVTRFDMPPSTRAAVLPRSAGLDTTVIPAPRMISTFSAALSPKARMIAPA